MKRLLYAILCLVLAGLFSAAAAGPAHAAAAPGPQVTVDEAVHLLAGKLSNTSTSPSLPAFVKWHQFDPYGITSESGYVEHYDNGWVRDASFNGVRTTLNFTARADEYYYVTIVATNSRGTTTTTEGYVGSVNLAQENTATYNAGWTTGSCACWSDGAALKSKKAGQMATFAFYGNQVALVTDKGPGRGTADLFLDGAKVGTLRAKAATTTNLLVVPTKYKVVSGQHTLQVKVTSGRIDIDGFVYTG